MVVVWPAVPQDSTSMSVRSACRAPDAALCYYNQHEGNRAGWRLGQVVVVVLHALLPPCLLGCGSPAGCLPALATLLSIGLSSLPLALCQAPTT